MGYCCRYKKSDTTTTRYYEKYAESKCPIPEAGYMPDGSRVVSDPSQCAGGRTEMFWESDGEYFNDHPHDQNQQMKAQHTPHKNV
ncbi:hypothetical protein [Ectobacillus panaciterrae]|uniref:hypothetical protein n=1 Tax=Ectobacillus panaciterrae TaxID=363872 RepID=UPI0004917AD3|nr:hypothetical protein [Ectobacillus panaciterrae]